MLIRTGRWASLGADAAKVRYQVFVVEQNVPVSIERDVHDGECVHVVAYDERGRAIGTGRLLPDGHIGRMAVLPTWRGKGVGSKMLQALVAAARQQNYAEVVLSAQVHARAFYEHHGFVAEGLPYEEAGIEHILMRQVFR